MCVYVAFFIMGVKRHSAVKAHKAPKDCSVKRRRLES